MDNIEIVRRACAHLQRRYEERVKGIPYTPIDFRPLYDLLDEDVVFEVPCTYVPEGGVDERTPPFNVVGKEHKGKRAFIEAFENDQSDNENWEVRKPLEYFANGDRVVVLHSERYEQAGVPVPWSESAMVFDLKDGKIVRYTHIADMSGHIAAYNEPVKK
ncbi:hypothetical protein BAY59_22745 [Prauserella coralliicola]|nr:hypothetical protein BAY59_22745 [Prauserella coralliicola]